MKFGHDLLLLEAGAPANLRGQFIQYKQLKKLLKQLPAAEDRTEAEQDFFRQLRAEVRAVNQRFEKQACEVLRQANARRRQVAAAKTCCMCLRRRRVSAQAPRASMHAQLQEEEILAGQARWCRKYARANAAGLRKIAKKHDKRAANDAGRRFVQACWDCRNMDMGAFLHSPLMAELEALEKLRRPSVVSAVGSLVSGGTDEAHEAAVDGSCSWRGCGSEGGIARPVSSAGDTSVTAGSTAGRGSCAGHDPVPGVDIGDDVGDSIEGGGGAEAAEKALHCPICLGPMYKPLGLGCGHKFCTECVLSVVRVEGADLLKPLRRILADVPHGTACPQCRQRAVFYNAVELKKLGAFIYATYPEEIEERAAASAQQLGELKREKTAKERAERKSRFDQYFQPFGYGL